MSLALSSLTTVEEYRLAGLHSESGVYRIGAVLGLTHSSPARICVASLGTPLVAGLMVAGSVSLATEGRG